MSEPIEYMTISIVANGIEVDRNPYSYRNSGGMRDPSKVFVFASIADFAEWCKKQTYAFTSDRGNQQ